MKIIKLGYTPCPNDTFLFYHFAHSIKSKFFQIKQELLDIEKLNELAYESIFDITKLSIANFFLPEILNQYELLPTGTTLGKNCGPLLIKRKNTTETTEKKILIPGKNTTANLLLNFHLKKNFKPFYIRYDKILNLIKNKEFDYGVVIHEERFTLDTSVFEIVQDLGKWWEEKTNLPLPLGVIAVKRDLEKNLKKQINLNLAESLSKAYKKDEKMENFILKNSQNKNLEVIQSHIDLYVNQFTTNLCEKGRKAIETLYKKSLEFQIIKKNEMNLLFN